MSIMKKNKIIDNSTIQRLPLSTWVDYYCTCFANFHLIVYQLSFTSLIVFNIMFNGNRILSMRHLIYFSSPFMDIQTLPNFSTIK